MTEGVPVVAGLLVSRQRPIETQLTLEVIASQTRPPDHLVVVNVEADDQTREVVAAFVASKPGFPCTYVPLAENVGPAGAVAVGVPEVLRLVPLAAFVVFFEDDDPPPDETSVAHLLAIAVRESRNDERFGGVGLVGARFDAARARLVPVRPMPGEVVPVDMLPGGWVPLWSRPALVGGGYDADLFFGLEELEFGLRARRAGFTVLAAPHGGVHPPVGQRSLQRATTWNWRRYYSLRNLVVVLLRERKVLPVLRVVARGLGAPLLGLALRRPGASAALVGSIRALHDGMRGRLGRRVEPDASSRP